MQTITHSLAENHIRVEELEKLIYKLEQLFINSQFWEKEYSFLKDDLENEKWYESELNSKIIFFTQEVTKIKVQFEEISRKMETFNVSMKTRQEENYKLETDIDKLEKEL